jgi:DNA-binding ferritin-like protein
VHLPSEALHRTSPSEVLAADRAGARPYQPHARPRRYAVTPKEMLAELCADNRHLTRSLRSTHEVCDRHNDVATASLIENWIDETERRTWFLSEIERDV